jgi:hypothetical protein
VIIREADCGTDHGTWHDHHAIIKSISRSL